MPGLSDAASVIGDVQVRNRGTIGGSVAHADPAADMPVILTALNASLVAQSPSGTRTIAVDDFFTDFYTTAIERERDPYGNSRADSACGNGHGLREAAASRIGLRRRQRRRVDHPTSIGLLRVRAHCHRRARQRSRPRHRHRNRVTRKPLTTQIIAAAAAKAAEETDPVEDSYSSAEYKQHVATVYARKAIEAAVERAKS